MGILRLRGLLSEAEALLRQISAEVAELEPEIRRLESELERERQIGASISDDNESLSSAFQELEGLRAENARLRSASAKPERKP